MTNTIRRELKFLGSPETVWRALTDSAVLAEWMYPNDFEPRVGHHFTFRVPPKPRAKFDGIVRCKVLKCVPRSELVFTWVVGEWLNTRVSYRLEPDGTGTRVLFEHTGFEQEQAFKGAEYGWNMMHAKLAKVLKPAANPPPRRQGADSKGA
jgi:uncharacterized protein YndB with AHSA1/START domain